MKQITRFLAATIVMLAFSAATFAQVSATAVASATIVSPIAITKTVDLNFGNIAAGVAAGTVVLSPAGVRTPTNVTLPATTGTVTAAEFNITGTPAYTYSIAIAPASVTITNGANNMTVDTFVSTPAVATGGTLDGTGAQTVRVGATLTVGASQPSGVYTNATAFSVTVNYN